MQSATEIIQNISCYASTLNVVEIVEQFGNKLRELKEPLGKLVSMKWENRLQEGYEEVQEND